MSDTPTPSLDDRIQEILNTYCSKYRRTITGHKFVVEDSVNELKTLISLESDKAVEAFAAELKKHSYNANSGIDDATGPYLAVGVDDIDQTLIERPSNERD